MFTHGTDWCCDAFFESSVGTCCWFCGDPQWTDSGCLSLSRDSRGSCSIKLEHQQSQGGPKNPHSSEWMTAVGLGVKRLLKLLQSPAVPQRWRMHSSSARERKLSLTPVLIHSWGGGANTDFPQIHWISLYVTASFNDTFLHWWESHSPIPQFLPKIISEEIAVVLVFVCQLWGSPQTQWSNQRLPGGTGAKGKALQQESLSTCLDLYLPFYVINRLAQVEMTHCLVLLGPSRIL